MEWGRLHFEVSGGRGLCFPGAAEPAGGFWGVPVLAVEQAETSSLQPWPLAGAHQSGSVEGFLATEPPFVLVCVRRLPEHSVGYPKLPSIIFFSLSQRQSISILSNKNLTRTCFRPPYLK